MSESGPPGFPEVRAAPRFRQRFPWLGGDLQTLRNHLLGCRADLSPWPARRLLLPLSDDSGDRLSASLHRPEGAPAGPSVVLIHGLTGCEDSAYIRASARALLSAGHGVLRLNLRGAGPSRETCRLGYHAGRSRDLADALDALAAAEPDFFDRGIVLTGYSLGANMLIKYLGERHPATADGCTRLLGAAAVSTPIDLKATQQRIMAPRNAVYHRYLLSRMKAEALATPGGLEEAERRAIAAARDVYQFDDRFVAPRNGFAGAEDYYARCSARRYLGRVGVPLLVIHALDDPWVPAAPYRTVDWSANPRLLPLLPRHGGHVGFHGRDGALAWHDARILEFVSRLERDLLVNAARSVDMWGGGPMDSRRASSRAQGAAGAGARTKRKTEETGNDSQDR